MKIEEYLNSVDRTLPHLEDNASLMGIIFRLKSSLREAVGLVKVKHIDAIYRELKLYQCPICLASSTREVDLVHLPECEAQKFLEG